MGPGRRRDRARGRRGQGQRTTRAGPEDDEGGARGRRGRGQRTTRAGPEDGAGRRGDGAMERWSEKAGPGDDATR
jgi:hypothetical protein